MRRFLILFILAGFFVFGSVVIVSQDDDACPTFVSTVLDEVGVACETLGSGEVCYGHNQIDVTFWDTAETVDFNGPADIVPVESVQSLTTSPLNLDESRWGVAVLKIRADIPDTLPGQSVTFLLMGDTELGSVEGGNMQAFYFSAGVGESSCKEAPNTLTIQSPQGITVTLDINGMEVTLGSTIMLTSIEVDGMTILVGTLIEGTYTAYTEAFTLELTEPGQSFAVTLNDEGQVDEESELVNLGDNVQVADAMAFGCDSLVANPFFEPPLAPDDCNFDIDYQTPEPPADVDPNLEDVGPNDACTLAAINTSNLRGGPGTNYDWKGQLAGGERANADGYANGADGFKWWRLTSGLWIRGDLVASAGDCGSLPVVEAPAPPQPPPQPSTGRIYEIALACDQLNNSVNAGDVIVFQSGIGRWDSVDEAGAALASLSATITIDGVSLPVYYEGITLHTGAGTADGYGERARAQWTATSGTHTAMASWSDPGYGTATCVFTVD